MRNTRSLTPEQRFELVMECRSSGLTDYRWCMEQTHGQIMPRNYFTKRICQRIILQLPERMFLIVCWYWDLPGKMLLKLQNLYGREKQDQQIRSGKVIKRKLKMWEPRIGLQTLVKQYDICFRGHIHIFMLCMHGGRHGLSCIIQKSFRKCTWKLEPLTD